MVFIPDLLEGYTVKGARYIQSHYLFYSLSNSSKNSTQKSSDVSRLRSDFFKGVIGHETIKRKFGKDVFQKSLKDSVESCVSTARKMLSEDSSLEECCACNDEGANYYVVHGQSAHKCLCAVCAMKVALKPSAKCPITRESVSLMVKGTNRSFKCVCREDKCERVVAVEESVVNKSRTFRAVVECNMCSLEAFDVRFCRIYILY